MKTNILALFPLLFIGMEISAQKADSITFAMRLDSTLTAKYDSQQQEWKTNFKEIFEYTDSADVKLNASYNFDPATNSWILNEKLITETDQNRNILVSEHYIKDSASNGIIGVRKYENQYDSENNLGQIIAFEWDSTANDWVPDYKKVYEHADHKETMEIGFHWNASEKKWEEYDKELTTYHANGTEEVFTDFNRDSANQEWLNNYKYEYGYDASSSLIETHYYEWVTDSSKWIKLERNDYIYSNGNLATIITQSLDQTSGEWVNTEKKEFTSNTVGKMLQYQDFTWNPENANWIPVNKFENAFNEDNNLVETADYLWDHTNNQWIGENRSAFVINDGDLEESIDYVWDDTGKYWEFSNRITYVFGADYDSSNIMLPSSLYNRRKMLSSQQNVWNDNSASFEPFLQTTYYYTVLNSSSVSDVPDFAIDIYPNPANKFLTISTDLPERGDLQILLYNAAGQEVFREELGKIQQIDLTPFKPNLYFVVIKNDRQVVLKEKIIIQH